MKRVKSACILQTLVFAQKEDSSMSREYAAKLNREDVENYKKSLGRYHTRFKIVEETAEYDGSIIIKIKKQYNNKTDIGEYFD